MGLDSIDFQSYQGAIADDVINALSSGDAHIIDPEFYISPNLINEATSIDYASVPDYGVEMMVVNMDHPILGTGLETPYALQYGDEYAAEGARQVREAISKAIPRDSIISGIFSGMGSPSFTLWPEYAPGYNSNNYFEYNIEAAQGAIENAGYELDFGESDFPIDPLYIVVALVIISIIILGTFMFRKFKSSKQKTQSAKVDTDPVKERKIAPVKEEVYKPSRKERKAAERKVKEEAKLLAAQEAERRAREEREQQLRQRIDTFRKIIKRSTTLKLSQLSDMLEMKEKDLMKWLYDLPDDFGFKINQDIVEFDVVDIDASIDSLIKSFEGMEGNHSGKL
ncbi:MAG: ABC transporter substrate-binding protein [Candidatus Kariarchaeaceae archaeon]